MASHYRSTRRRTGATLPRVILALALPIIPATQSPLRAAGSDPVNGGPEPIYWRERQFFIPYQAGASFGAGKVRLEMARDASQNWVTLQEAAPNVRGFGYHAPADGEYLFAVTLVDSHGARVPPGPPTPQLRVIVDTQPPLLRLAASPDVGGQVVVRYEAADPHLRPETLIIEAQSGDGRWEQLRLGPPDVSYPDRLLGQAAWTASANAGGMRFRATIEDRAGNRGTTTAEGAMAAGFPSTAVNPFGGRTAVGSEDSLRSAASAVSPVDWPLNNATPAPIAGLDAASTAPPLQNPYTEASAKARVRTPALLTGNESGATAPATQAWSAPPPSLLSADRAATSAPRAPALELDDGWQAAHGETAGQQQNAEIHWINSLTVDIEYDLQTIGPWGVSKVEVWATPDGGQSWSSLGVDADSRSPYRATMPGDGVYGFRIVVDGAGGSPAARPLAGDKPELTVGVDIQPPRAEIVEATVGQGEFSDHLVIRWLASDEQLASRPVTLLLSETAEGPWTTIAADLANTGEYRWRLTRKPPQKIFLRLEVRDLAGNIATYQTPAPIVLILPQPTGRLRSVKPVTTESGRYRTADGRF